MIYDKETTEKFEKQKVHNERKELIENNVKRVFISEHICSSCGCLVENEEVFRIGTYVFIEGSTVLDHYEYYCNNCCKTIDDLVDKCSIPDYLIENDFGVVQTLMPIILITYLATLASFFLAYLVSK